MFIAIFDTGKSTFSLSQFDSRCSGSDNFVETLQRSVWSFKIVEMSSESIQIYHAQGMRSTRCVWLYQELKLKYGARIPELEVIKFDAVEFKSNPKSAEFLALNPNGKLPVLADGEINMWDSCAICFYLLDKYDLENEFYPKGGRFKYTYKINSNHIKNKN